MQESNGMVRQLLRNSDRIGIFQVPISEAASCEGIEMNKCSAATITEMAENGIYGHASMAWGPRYLGLAYWIVTQENVAIGLRGYNSRSIIDANDLTIVPTGERAYVSDIANRLVGAKFGARRDFTC